MNKTVSSVIDDINAWERTPGSFIYYVTAIFTDESVGSVGRKDHDAALEVQGLLREAIGQEMEFTLEAKGQTKTGRDKFNIKGFGTPGGAATYTAPGVQGGAVAATGTPVSRQRSPEQDVSIRASVAIKAAVELGGDINTVFENADAINAWLVEKTSEPASSAYENGSGTVPPVVQAGAGSETPSGPRVGPASAGEGSGPGKPGQVGPDTSSDSAGVSEPTGAESESGGGVAVDAVAESLGKEQAPPPHIHDWQQRQGLRGFLVCDCGETRKKESVT
jgi:hypothetical protein